MHTKPARCEGALEDDSALPPMQHQEKPVTQPVGLALDPSHDSLLINQHETGSPL